MNGQTEGSAANSDRLQRRPFTRIAGSGYSRGPATVVSSAVRLRPMADPIRTYQEIVAQLEAKGITPEQIHDVIETAWKARAEAIANEPIVPIRDDPGDQIGEVLERLQRIEDKLDQLGS